MRHIYAAVLAFLSLNSSAHAALPGEQFLGTWSFESGNESYCRTPLLTVRREGADAVLNGREKVRFSLVANKPLRAQIGTDAVGPIVAEILDGVLVTSFSLISDENAPAIASVLSTYSVSGDTLTATTFGLAAMPAGIDVGDSSLSERPLARPSAGLAIYTAADAQGNVCRFHRESK